MTTTTAQQKRVLDPLESAILGPSYDDPFVRMEKLELANTALNAKLDDGLTALNRRLNRFRLWDGMVEWFERNWGEATFFMLVFIAAMTASVVVGFWAARPPLLELPKVTVTQLCSTERFSVVITDNAGVSQQLPVGFCASEMRRPDKTPEQKKDVKP